MRFGFFGSRFLDLAEGLGFGWGVLLGIVAMLAGMRHDPLVGEGTV